MVDIETLGNSPTSAILSIGAIEFDPDSNAIGEGFYTLIDIDSCLKNKLTVDGSTICWWMTQSDAAREIFNKQSTALKLDSALIELKMFIERLSKSPIMWCNGSNFDAPILDNAFRRVGVTPPWQYYNVRDYRTICKALPKNVLDTLKVNPDVAHNAYHDAVAQAHTLQNIYSLKHERQS